MKKYFLFFLVIITFNFVSYGQCPTTTITLTTQAEVDAFAASYPGCTQITDGLTISGDDIDNLSSLSIITSVNGIFNIEYNSILLNLNGLENISVINNNEAVFKIRYNNQLENILGLSGISGEILSLQISNNAILQSLEGLEGITALNGMINITYNNALTNLNGLNNIENCSNLRVTNNDNLLSFEGLNNLNSIELLLSIVNNYSLLNIEALQSLQSIGYLLIDQNAALMSLEGLENISTLGNFEIRDNDSLTNLIGLQGLVITSSDSSIKMNDNLTSVSGLISEFEFETVYLEISNNPSLITLEGLIGAGNEDIILGGLTIYDNDLIIDFTGLEAISSITSFEVNSCNSIENFNGLQDVYFENGQILIKNNLSLTNMDGFIANGSSFGLLLENNSSLLDLTGLEGTDEINSLTIRENDILENVDALANSNITNSIWIQDNPSLTSIVGLGGNYESSISTVIINNDLLESLDGLENLLLGSVFLKDNQTLQDISALEYLDIEVLNNLTIKNNPNLSECNILSICNYLPEGNNIDIQNNAIGCNNETEILDACNFTFNVFTGNVRFDFNDNGCDNEDYSAGSILIEMINGVNVYSTFTNSEGNYTLFIEEEGTFTLSVAPDSLPQGFVASPVSEEITFIGFGNMETVDFCIEAIEVFNDLKILLFPLNDARPGFDADYRIVVENIGTTALNGDVMLQFDDARQTFLNAIPAEDNISENTITWSFSDLLPFQSRTIDIAFNTLPPPTNDSGDVLVFEATINPISGDENPLDNVYTLEQTIVNSQDPNDKQVMQGIEIYADEVGNYLDYMVRFQNVGTADAINVRVDDLLSENLNWNTFRPLSSSHEYRIEILDGNQVSFIFDDIYLPSEDSDPEGSQGYIAFQVRSLETLSIGDVVINGANIFFDFNAPIETNTVTTIVVEDLSINDNIINKIKIFPNPTKGILNIEANGLIMEDITILNLQGIVLKNTSNKNEIDVSNLTTGIYFIQLSVEGKTITKKFIKN